jgi:hypothetical protein
LIARLFARPSTRLAAAGAIGAALGVVAIATGGASCTVFNGLVAEEDAGGGGQGVDGGPTPWMPPELAYLALDDAARLCRWVLECDRLADSIVASIAVPVDAENFSQCLHWAAGPLPPGHRGITEQRTLLEALSQVGSCEEALATTYVEVISPASEPRCGGEFIRKCDGDLAIDCTDIQIGTISRCSSARFSPSGHTCFAGFCVHDDCASTMTTYECVDEVGYVCNSMKEVGIACTPLGLTCASPLTCGASESSTPTCNALGETSCSTEHADVVQVCSGLLVTEFACDKIVEGGTCAVTGEPRCAAASDACTPVDPGQNSCDAAMLTACVAGQHIVFDCASIGLACKPAAGEKTGRCGAP